jgi:hypothetical protein
MFRREFASIAVEGTERRIHNGSRAIEPKRLLSIRVVWWRKPTKMRMRVTEIDYVGVIILVTLREHKMFDSITANFPCSIGGNHWKAGIK